MGDVPTWVYVLVPPVYLSAGVLIVRTVRFWPDFMARWNERQRDKENAKDGDWKRLREEVERLSGRVKHLEERCERYEEELIDCHRERDEERAFRLRAEAILQGHGEVRQLSAGIVAGDRLARRDEEREADAKARKGEGGE